MDGSEQTDAAVNLQHFFDHVFDRTGRINEPSGCDTAHYLDMLDDVDIPSNEKTELVHSLWHVLDGLVRLQFGIHPLTDIMNEKAAMRASNSVSMVNLSPIKTDKGDTS